MTTVRIYQPSKSAMQSGKGALKKWIVTFEPEAPLLPDPLMGWNSSRDMSQELHLSFFSLEKAIEFAKVRDLSYTICNPPKSHFHKKNYAANFGPPQICS